MEVTIYIYKVSEQDNPNNVFETHYFLNKKLAMEYINAHSDTDENHTRNFTEMQGILHL